MTSFDLEEAILWVRYGAALTVFICALEYLALRKDILFRMHRGFTLLSFFLLLGSMGLALGLHPYTAFPLLLIHLMICAKLGGSFNGGSDFMISALLLSLTSASFFEAGSAGRKYSLVYLIVQTVFSYFVSGLAKLKEGEWRNGTAISKLLALQTYPVPARLKDFFSGRSISFCAAWMILVFEVFFPLALSSPQACIGFLALGVFFHLFNAAAFGLNRFLYAWLATYPALYWMSAQF